MLSRRPSRTRGDPRARHQDRVKSGSGRPRSARRRRAARARSASAAARAGRAGRAPAAAGRAARRWCRARARRGASTSTASSPSSTSRCAPRTDASRRSASSRSRSCADGWRPGSRTTSTSSSAPSRWDERQARRTTRSRARRARPARAAARRSPAPGGGSEQPLLAQAERLAHQPLRLDVLGHLAQRDLAQRLQVLDPEEAVERRRHALAPRRPCPRAAASMSASGVRSISTTSSASPSTRVGHRLAHAHAGQLGHLVVERLEVLDVDGREHVDPGGEHVGDVLVALGVLDAGGVGVRQLVDQAQLGRAREHAGQVHLLEAGAAVRDAPARDQLEAVGERGGRRLAAVGLEQPDGDVAAGLGLGLALLQHAVGLADPGRHAEEDLVVAGHRVRAQAVKR